MRLFPLIIASALALGACRNSGQADNAIKQDDGLTAANIVANDVTAIDAVTAQAANIADDVDYSDMLNALANNAADSATPPAKPGTSRSTPAARPNAQPSAPAATQNETTTNAQ